MLGPKTQLAHLQRGVIKRLGQSLLKVCNEIKTEYIQFQVQPGKSNFKKGKCGESCHVKSV